MLSLRTLARSVPRCARSVSSQSVRCSLRNIQRPSAFNIVSKPSLVLRSAATFSTSTRRFQQENEGEVLGLVNDELAAKLESELSLEKDMRDPDVVPSYLKDYIDNSSFKIEDSPGTEEVIMSREFGDEKIRIIFSISDLNDVDEDADQLQEDPSMMDEDDPTDLPESAQSGGANTKGSINQGRTSGGNIRVAPEDRVAPADRDELAEDDMGEESEETPEPSFPAHLNITIEKANKGALQIEAIAQDGLIIIEQVYYHKQGVKAPTANITSTDFKGDPYAGPPFGNLDEDLQVLFEKYLEERGVNTQMALFVPEYIDFKEQREYLNWLTGVKNFVE